MIKKNGSGYAFDLSGFLVILTIIGSTLFVYFNTIGSIKEALVNHEVRITQNELCISKNAQAIEKVEDDLTDHRLSSKAGK